MRMQKEEKVVVVLLLMALGSIAVGFWAFGPNEGGLSSSYVSPKDLSQNVEGQILEVKPTNSGGNLLIRLDSTALSIFVPASAGAEALYKQLHVGDRIKIKGTVSGYKGTDELVVSRSTDVIVQKN
jgi:DNA/RNA endonuclease YhcR with UshA esterase domain